MIAVLNEWCTDGAINNGNPALLYIMLRAVTGTHDTEAQPARLIPLPTVGRATGCATACGDGRRLPGVACKHHREPAPAVPLFLLPCSICRTQRVQVKPAGRTYSTVSMNSGKPALVLSQLPVSMGLVVVGPAGRRPWAIT